MRPRHHLAVLSTIAGLLAAPVTFAACAGYGVEERIYDPFAGVYVRWGPADDRLYRRWELETRRPHIDFVRRPVEERRAYFAWRRGR